MGDFDKVFGDFIKSKSKFLDLPDGAEIVVVFLGVGHVTTNFKGKEVSCLRYLFDMEGQQRNLDRSSRALAIQMSKFSRGDKLRIKRIGERNQTKYIIQKEEDK